MRLLLITRDRKWVARMKRLYPKAYEVTVVTDLSLLVDKTKVPEYLDMVLLDIERLKPDKWPKYVANLRKMLDFKVVVVDPRGNWRHARQAYENYAVGYFTKAARTKDAEIIKVILHALSAGLPHLPNR